MPEVPMAPMAPNAGLIGPLSVLIMVAGVVLVLAVLAPVRRAFARAADDLRYLGPKPKRGAKTKSPVSTPDEEVQGASQKVRREIDDFDLDIFSD